MTGRPPSGWRRTLYRIPVALYRAHLGVLLGRRYVLVNHVGRRSGLARQVVLEVVVHDAGSDAVTVAAGFGTTSDWYRNLLAHPDARIQLGGRTLDVRAVVMAPEQAAEAMLRYARKRPRSARGLVRFMGFTVAGSDDGYRSVGRELPMLRFEPVWWPRPAR